ncbi:MAG: gliding motility-associated C-terminal domain-containing protein [Flavobacteriales bacterium]|jgi:gliding motility-associated-like protein
MLASLKFILTLILLGAFRVLFGQLSSTGCEGLTSYTDGQPNDPIYYFPTGQLGELTVVPEVAGSSFNFVWYRFTTGSFNWTSYLTENNQASSTISNLQPGAYFVSVRNSSNVIVGCYRAWIAQILQEPSVDVQPIPSNCVGPIALSATFTPGQITPISNLPQSQLVIDANTQITVCFTGTHTYVSDLGFYLKGPSSCGSPTLALMPNPGGACNPSNNFTNFCFSTESTNNINVCSGVNGLSGTYGTYGPTATPVNWSGIYGCDAMNGGWTVQVYDCVGIDVGTLTDATITFVGFDLCGASQTISYTTPPNFSSNIADNSCSAASASSFNVAPAFAPAILNCSFGYEWNSNPYVYIPDSTTSLNISLNSLTDAQGNPIAWQNIDFTLDITVNCDENASLNDCFGGNQSDTETYVNIPQTQSVITPMAPICAEDGVVQLTADIAGGNWSGPGITDALLGTFDPTLTGEGFFDIQLSFADPCILPDTETLEVGVLPNLTVNFQDDVCEDTPAFDLMASTVGGVYSGPGIVDPNLGTFDPALAGVGAHVITYTSGTICPITLNETVNVQPLPVLTISPDSDVCPGTTFSLSATGADSYLWSPATNLDDATNANPQATVEAPITYTLVGTSVFGCESTAEVTLTPSAEPFLSVNAISTICPGEFVTVDAAGSTGTWSWIATDGTEISATPSLTISPVATTDIVVSVTDACGLIADTTVTVPVESGYSVDAGLDDLFCEGESLLLSAAVNGAAPIIQWTSIDGVINGAGDQESLTIDVQGTYSITVTSPLGCVYSDDVFITEASLPIVTLGPDQEICANQPFGLSAAGALSYNWTPATGLSSSTVANPNVTIAAPAEYIVLGTDINGCQQRDTIALTLIALPNVAVAAVSMICPGASLALEATGSTGAYVWSPATGLNTTFGSTVTATPDATTLYTITLTDACGEQATATVNVAVEQAYSVAAGVDDFFCEGGEFTMNPEVSGPNPSLEWSTLDGNIVSGGNQSTAVVNAQGTYLITLTSPLACVYNDVVFINEVSYPNVDFPDTVRFCPGSAAELSAGIMWDLVQWSTGQTGSDISIAQQGTYDVAVTNGGCTTYDTLFVKGVVLPVINLGPDVEICQDESAVLTAGYEGQWQGYSQAEELEVVSAGTYMFTYTQEGCSISDEIEVEVIPLPYFNSPSTQYACIGETYIIDLTSPLEADYLWSHGGQLSYTEVDQPGTYYATITNECGTRVASIDVVFEDCESAVFTPTTFTPNNDGLNDVWQIVTRNIQSLNAKVMNRWGQVVFESTDLNPVWTGGFDAGDTYVADGYYFWRVEYVMRNGQRNVQEGSMFILR